MIINKKKSYVLNIIDILSENYKFAGCTLNFSNPFELLVATILSAQCKDERINKITEILFKKYKNIKEYAEADVSVIENYIRSAGFFRNKAKNIVGSAKLIMSEYNGNVPQTMKKLLKLPGVARKTANVVLSSAFKKIEGIVVDTHVMRISNLLELTENNNSVRIEKDLMKIVPQKYWIKLPFLMQILGRRICKARNQNHVICPLNSICPKQLSSK
ncbi:MAG: endonuclease III [Endomicrobium sp.]|jgi:endonuclease-3|nr:endonuclease III [Endomicrobium sp.]